MPNKPHVIVIGAGPGGLVTAAYLLDRNIDVTIVERSVFPRTIVGESLLPLSMEHFKAVGFYDSLLDANFEVKSGARFIKGQKIFDFGFDEGFTAGAETWTWQVPRADFDQIMADKVVQKGGTIHFDSMVTDLAFDTSNSAVSITAVSGDETTQLTGDFLVDASGFGCVVPRLLGQEITKNIYPNWAVFTHVEDTRRSEYPEAERISFEVLATDLWFWMIPFSNGITSLGFAGHKRHFEENPVHQEDYFRSLVSKSEKFGERFAAAPFCFQPKWHKGYSQSASELYGDHHVLVGNATEFLDPVFSSGVALATKSAMEAADRIVRHLEGSDPDWEGYVDLMHSGTDVFRSFVESWYSGDLQHIFFTSERMTESIKRKIISVLAGYVWDTNNEFTVKHRRGLPALARVARF